MRTFGAFMRLIVPTLCLTALVLGHSRMVAQSPTEALKASLPCDTVIERDLTIPGNPVTAISFDRIDAGRGPTFFFGDESVRLLKQFRHLRRLDLEPTDVTDKGLDQLRDLPALTELILPLQYVTPEGLPAISQLSSLRRLSITIRGISDSDLKHLARL